MKKLILGLISLSLIILISCKKENNDIDEFNLSDQEKIDYLANIKKNYKTPQNAHFSYKFTDIEDNLNIEVIFDEYYNYENFYFYIVEDIKNIDSEYTHSIKRIIYDDYSSSYLYNKKNVFSVDVPAIYYKSSSLKPNYPTFETMQKFNLLDLLQITDINYLNLTQYTLDIIKDQGIYKFSLNTTRSDVINYLSSTTTNSFYIETDLDFNIISSSINSLIKSLAYEVNLEISLTLEKDYILVPLNFEDEELFLTSTDYIFNSINYQFAV
ncbi:MAG: hypothetical protein LBV58_02940 [Acholeplasmatales bacterium]|jgi:hypothetical protein|nr:hypothetical protein [Acholeplasmatales bacterium]